MKFELNQYHRDLSDDQLLEDMRTVAKKLHKGTITREEYNQHGEYHAGTIRKRFKGWLNALKKAGLEKSRNYNIEDVDLFKNLEEIWTKLGRQPVRNDLKYESRFSSATYERRFGTWRKSLEAFVEYINEDSTEFDESYEKEVDEDDIQKEESGKKKMRRTKRHISDRLRFKILLRDGFTCRKCGRSPLKKLGVELHVDHILPWSKGGETVTENLETKCKQCNLGKGNAFEV
jgi:rubrerythrin